MQYAALKACGKEQDREPGRLHGEFERSLVLGVAVVEQDPANDPSHGAALGSKMRKHPYAKRIRVAKDTSTWCLDSKKGMRALEIALRFISPVGTTESLEFNLSPASTAGYRNLHANLEIYRRQARGIIALRPEAC